MSPQSTIAHYRIVGKLGEGGMGAVYRATDTKLNRDVAIKVLPEGFAQDSNRMTRFAREAQVLASLNHPNIAAIYGVEEGALVMELVDGKDLAGPVALDTALDYAKQIATGLEAAHEKGIVHRDLKPANIKVTPEGVVKLLDFGLAKAAEETPPAGSAGPTMSPTISLAMTQAGMILGTAAYMSPEQARGKPVDKRADIWAFGVVLYELLTNTALFGGGETISDALAAVITKEPDWTALPKETPPHVRRLLQRCLRKDPKVRLRDIGEARIALENPDPAPQLEAAAVGHVRGWAPWAVATLAVATAATTGSMLWFRTAAPERVAVRFHLPFPEDTQPGGAPAGPEAVPSPDGRSIAFIAGSTDGTSTLWVRPIGSPEAHRLDKTAGAGHPFWSPDSQFIGFFADQKLKKVSAAGGSPQTLCDVSVEGTRVGGDGGTWNADGVIVFSRGSGSPLLRVLAAGGPATPVTALDEPAGERMHSWPQFLPDGRHLLYFAGNRDYAKGAIYVQELGSSQRVLLTRSMFRGAWSPPGYLLFMQEQTLFAQRMDPRTFQLNGEPVLITDSVRANEVNGRAAFAVSGGVLTYRGGAPTDNAQLAWYSRDGKRLGTVGKPGAYLSVRLSPDEKSAALAVGTVRQSDLWILDLTSGVFTRMTTDNQSSLYIGPWSADSQRIVVNRSSSRGMLELSVASAKMRPLGDAPVYAQDWSPDGRLLACSRGGGEWAVLPLEGDMKPEPIQKASSNGFYHRFSPDGKFVAYATVAGNLWQIVVASFPSFAEKRQVSIDGGSYPHWRKDGKELFFLKPDGTLMSASINLVSRIEAGVPKALFQARQAAAGYLYAATGDGQRFLVIERGRTGAGDETMIVVNWDADLKRP